MTATPDQATERPPGYPTSRIPLKQKVDISVCIIGGGPCGLSAFKRLRQQGYKRIVCLEKQPFPGGIWNYDARIGIDKNSYFTSIGKENHVHGSMYLHLFSNGPKECIEYPDYSFKEHFGRKYGSNATGIEYGCDKEVSDLELPSFPPRHVVKDYILGRHADVVPEVRCNCEVIGITGGTLGGGALPSDSMTISDFLAQANAIQVTWRQSIQDHYSHDLSPVHGSPKVVHEIFTESFDRLIVASGHFSKPFIPEFPGLDEAQKRGEVKVIHVHNYRDAMEELNGKSTMVVGASCSAEDIASHAVKYGGTKVTIACREGNCHVKTMGWPDYVAVKSNINRVELGTSSTPTLIHHTDNSTSSLPDIIVLCTGYSHYFPFFEESGNKNGNTNRNPLLLDIKGNSLFLKDLYRGVVFTKSPNVAYLGMMDQWYTFPLFDAQASYLAKIWNPQQGELSSAKIWNPEKGELSSANAPAYSQKGGFSTLTMEQIQSHTDGIEKDVYSKVKVRRDQCTFQQRMMQMLYRKSGVWYTNEEVATPMRRSLNITDKNIVPFDIKSYGEHSTELFMNWQTDKMKMVLAYRNVQHRNYFTGKFSSKPKFPWLDDHTDQFSVEKYIELYKDLYRNTPTVGINKNLSMPIGNGEKPGLNNLRSSCPTTANSSSSDLQSSFMLQS